MRPGIGWSRTRAKVCDAAQQNFVSAAVLEQAPAIGATVPVVNQGGIGRDRRIEPAFHAEAIGDAGWHGTEAVDVLLEKLMHKVLPKLPAAPGLTLVE